MEPAPQLEFRTGQQQATQRQPLQGQDDHPVGLAKQDCRGFHADLQVIVAVGHRVVGVITHRPHQVGDVQQPGCRRQFAGFSGERHRHAPGERRPQHHLWVIGVALHEWVAERQRQAAE
ncbi:hypothetical protein D3C76_1473590 [compost metagenome]